MALATSVYTTLFCGAWLAMSFVVGWINEYFDKREGRVMQTRILLLSNDHHETEAAQTALRNAMYLSMED